MTPPRDSDFDIFSASLDELHRLYDGTRTTAPGVTETGTSSSTEAYRILQGEAAGDNGMVQIYGRDRENGLVQPFFSNEGEGYGLRASFILDAMSEAGTSSLSNILPEWALYGEVGKIDYFILRVYHDE